ncbi:MAG: fibrobacter succinogenes major paralogous domain-containing protein [Bacteroidales bacterium]|jgi:uncharacterized protein (TIGR02145 family)|nr:fibrobacter succinogenes major paralogous domain-containing protein [Bacteroidales bacterium]
MKKNLFKIISVAILLLIVTAGCKKDIPVTGVTPAEPEEKGVMINGVTWSTRNVDKPGTFAAKPEDAGMFYQWNRNIGWSTTDPLTPSSGSATLPTTTPSGDSWITANDPCPTGWRVPTRAELDKLVSAGSVWKSTGVPGIIFGSGDNTVFFPAAGYRVGDGMLVLGGDNGIYWSGTPNPDYSMFAYYLGFYSGNAYTDGYLSRRDGFLVRCVSE